MPLINPTIGASSQFIAPFDLISDIELKWKSPINSAGSQFVLSTIFNTSKDPSGYNNPTFDILSAIEIPGKWINPSILVTKYAKPDANDKTYDPLNFITGYTYTSPKTLAYAEPKELNKTAPDTEQYTYQPSSFTVTSSYSADIKKVALNPVNDQKVVLPTNTFTFNIGKSDGERYTYDPISFVPGGKTYAPDGTIKNNTNSNLTQFAIKAGATGIAATTVGVPQVAQAAQAALLAGFNGISSQYSTLPHDALTRKDQTAAILYPDFRAKQVLYGAVNKIRLDGTAAAFRGSKIAKGYVAASATLGAYAVFNIDGAGQTGYGIGDPGTPLKIRTDFTMRSHVAKKWDSFDGKYVPTKNFIEKHTPFVGDRVNVIDYQKSRELDKTKGLKDIYKWNTNGKGKNSYTRDFIKFFFTGPGINKNGEGKDDIIVFRATIGSLSDRFSPQWTEQRFIGRADPNYTYTQYSRELDLDFTIIATDRDELQPIWRKLNALASYTTPEYNTNSLAPIGPWMRFTLGDLYQQQPCFISSLSYTLHDTDTTWEINIEDDPAMMQSPHKISVSLGLTLVTDTIPQKNGKFYGFESSDSNYSWLKDFEPPTTGLSTVGLGSNWDDTANTNPNTLTAEQNALANRIAARLVNR